MQERLQTSMVPSLSCLVVVCTPLPPFTIPASFCMCNQTSAPQRGSRQVTTTGLKQSSLITQDRQPQQLRVAIIKMFGCP